MRATIACAVCASTDVQIPIWTNPNTGENDDDFGTINEPDARYCATCAIEGRDEHPPLVLLSHDAGTCGYSDCGVCAKRAAARTRGACWGCEQGHCPQDETCDDPDCGG